MASTAVDVKKEGISVDDAGCVLPGTNGMAIAAAIAADSPAAAITRHLRDRRLRERDRRNRCQSSSSPIENIAAAKSAV